MSDSSNDTVADEAYELGAQVDSFVEERPLTALAIALVAGALVARYVFSSRPSDDELGDPSIHRDHGASAYLERLRHRIVD